MVEVSNTSNSSYYMFLMCRYNKLIKALISRDAFEDRVCDINGSQEMIARSWDLYM
jgi:hypothetical protein